MFSLAHVVLISALYGLPYEPYPEEKTQLLSRKDGGAQIVSLSRQIAQKDGEVQAAFLNLHFDDDKRTLLVEGEQLNLLDLEWVNMAVLQVPKRREVSIKLATLSGRKLSESDLTVWRHLMKSIRDRVGVYGIEVVGKEAKSIRFHSVVLAP